MARLTTSIVACALLLAYGCSKKPTADPVADMKECVRNLESYYNITHKTNDDDGFPDTVSNISYDVRKTDSLVSPFTGYVLYTEGIPHQHKVEYHKLTFNTDIPSYDWKVELVYQENHWVVKRKFLRITADDGIRQWKESSIETVNEAKKAMAPEK